MNGLSDLWKCIVTGIIGAVLTFCLTLVALWLVIIKEHQAMRANVGSVCKQQVATWQKIGDHSERISALEAIWKVHKEGTCPGP